MTCFHQAISGTELPEVNGMLAVYELFPNGLLGYEFTRNRAKKAGKVKALDSAMYRASWALACVDRNSRCGLDSTRYMQLAVQSCKRLKKLIASLY